MPLTIKRFTGGPIETNAYLIVDSATGDATMVDAPPGIASDVLAMTESLGASINDIIVTHGHWDHILGLHELRETTEGRVCGHPDLRDRIENPQAGVGPYPMTPVSLECELKEGDEEIIGGHVFTVMHMPGHDIAHIVLYSEIDGLLLGGDVLFPGGHGRTDLPGSDQETMDRTLLRFLDFHDDVQVLPGHGEPTTIGRERIWIEQIRQR